MKKQILILLLPILLAACQSQKSKSPTQTAIEDGYKYEFTKDDPMGTRIYTLKNGLKVYLSQYTDAPRAHVLIPVRAGGKNDPADNTGLAHYLEHMMFKGTSNFGTLDYAKEKVLLDSIELMFEHYGTLTDSTERKAYYKKIDAVSNRAAKFAIPNEFDQMTSALGAKGTNAWTTNDETVYTMDIPANELERYLKIEGDRFKQIVGRLFHTELETVYEEKNRKSDGFEAYMAVLNGLYPNHPYGTQSVIGTVEHLKNPSITAIKNYFNTYYRPNNVAVCISGDIEYSKTIKLIDQYFGDWLPNDTLPVWQPEQVPTLSQPQYTEILGPESEFVYLGFKFDGRTSKDYLLLQLIDMILNNANAGLIDINLKQGQKVLAAGCYPSIMADYSTHFLYGYPKEGQTLEEVRDLILGQIDLVKKGEFDNWLIDAIIKDFKKSQMKELEGNRARANSMKEAFVNNIPWHDFIREIDEMEKITKEEIVAFANAKYGDNYFCVYKKLGEDPDKQIVEKPEITKVPVNRGVKSAFHEEMASMNVEKINPVFVDYNGEIDKSLIKGTEMISKVNQENELFQLAYIYEFGSNELKEAEIAAEYLEYIGSGEWTAEDFKKELYKLGCDFNVNVGIERTTVRINGLDESMDKAVALVEQMLSNPGIDQEALDQLIDRILKGRADDKLDRQLILREGLVNYCKYGSQNPFTNVLSNSELKGLKAEQMTAFLQNLTKWPHRILYYGPRPANELEPFIDNNHQIATELQPLPARREFIIKESEGNIYWTHFDMKQSEIVFISKNIDFNTSLTGKARMYNEYFGGGMNSILFQEIREAQALAYSVHSRYDEGDVNRANTVFAYIGTQADKQGQAMSSMLTLLDEIPASEGAFEIAQQSLMNTIESERITKQGVLWNYLSALDKGIDFDIRSQVYQEAKSMTLADVLDFQKTYIKGKSYNIGLIGDKNQIDIENLKTFGQVRELTLEEIFGY